MDASSITLHGCIFNVGCHENIQHAHFVTVPSLLREVPLETEFRECSCRLSFQIHVHDLTCVRVKIEKRCSMALMIAEKEAEVWSSFQGRHSEAYNLSSCPRSKIGTQCDPQCRKQMSCVLAAPDLHEPTYGICQFFQNHIIIRHYLQSQAPAMTSCSPFSAAQENCGRGCNANNEAEASRNADGCLNLQPYLNLCRKEKEKYTPAKRPHALRKGSLTSKLERVSPKGPQA
eukprot:1148614-Pelagomonas_calceolata.AAC.4